MQNISPNLYYLYETNLNYNDINFFKKKIKRIESDIPWSQ